MIILNKNHVLKDEIKKKKDKKEFKKPKENKNLILKDVIKKKPKNIYYIIKNTITNLPSTQY